LIDSNEDREMDFASDDQRDYMDQDIPAGKFLTAQSGFWIHCTLCNAQFLSDMPDWILNLDEHDSRRNQLGS
jgi:hypothetical protein